jgi:hypothetical protein
MLRRQLFALFAITVAFLLSACASRARNATPVESLSPTSPADLEELVAPIALYPDPLLQRILTAATFPDQIVDAALFLQQGGTPSDITHQSWERSVKYVANYPTILSALATDIDRTIQLGTAFTLSPDELRESIQSLRRRAREQGNLKSSTYQTVLEEGPAGSDTTIRIEPTDPEQLYVPSTQTTVIYERPVAEASTFWAPLATFGLGVALATALDHDDYYYYGGPFYGPGFWYGGPAYRRWYDYRHERWGHAYDYGRRHHEDWAKHRHDLDQRHSEWRRHQHSTDHRRPSHGSTSDSRASFRLPPPRGAPRDSRHQQRAERPGSSTSRPQGRPHGGSVGGHGFSGHRGGGRR